MKEWPGIIALMLVFGSALQAQNSAENIQDLSQFNDSSKTTPITVNPDQVELMLELDPNAYGYRARTRSMQINLELDPLFVGRAVLGFQLKILESLMLDFPVYFEASQASLPLGKWTGLINNNLESYWGVGAGIGLKWRVSEWTSKSSFYLLPRVKAGYYSQKGAGFNPANGVSLTPELIFGWERIFDVGFVIGAQLGVEKLFVFPLQTLALPYIPLITINPSIQLGYAW